MIDDSNEQIDGHDIVWWSCTNMIKVIVMMLLMSAVIDAPDNTYRYNYKLPANKWQQLTTIQTSYKDHQRIMLMLTNSFL